jgi:hypothetical protein
MKKILFYPILILFLAGCNNETPEKSISELNITTNDSTSVCKDSMEVLNLIRKVMVWTDSKDQIATIPLKGNDSNICIGVDDELQKQNTNKLAKSTYFTNNFILNYDRIIHSLDNLIKEGKVEKFDIAEMPPFSFGTDASPWCNCQDNFGWHKIIAKNIKFGVNTCELTWGWKNWKDYSYKVKLIKEKGVWKIDQMEGFDYFKATKI